MGRSSDNSCTGCTVVTIGVCSDIRPSVKATAYSKSEYPPPLPSRAPSLFTATDPQTIKSIGRISSGCTSLPSCASALDTAGQPVVADTGRVQLHKALFQREPGHGHIHGLPLLQREPSKRPLRQVGVRLNHPGLLPHLQLGKLKMCPPRSREVWYPTHGPGNAATPASLIDCHTSFRISSLSLISSLHSDYNLAPSSKAGLAHRTPVIYSQA